MKRKKIFGMFSRKPLIWFHYSLLLLFLYLGVLFNNSYLSDVNWIWTTIFFYIVISLGDQVIHKILNVN